MEDAEADLLAFYAFPAEHWPKLRSTNPRSGQPRDRPPYLSEASMALVLATGDDQELHREMRLDSPAPPCAGVLSGAAAALGAPVARVESRDGFLVRACTFWAGSDRYLLVQVNRGVAASRDQYELSRLPGDRAVAGVGQAARWTRDTGLLDVLDGPARFQVGLFTPAGVPAAAEPSPELVAAARAVAAHL